MSPSGAAPSNRTGALDATSAAKRARSIKLVLTDCDGVLTDTGVYYSEHGEAMKRFSIRDGMGVERLRNAGIATAIITGERSPSVKHRADKLGIEAYLGVRDKAKELDAILEARSITTSEIAYIGDDVNDLSIMGRIGPEGLLGAPGDAMPEVRAAVHCVTQALGGHGAFRELAEWILALRAADTSPTREIPRDGGE